MAEARQLEDRRLNKIRIERYIKVCNWISDINFGKHEEVTIESVLIKLTGNKNKSLSLDNLHIYRDDAMLIKNLDFPKLRVSMRKKMYLKFTDVECEVITEEGDLTAALIMFGVDASFSTGKPTIHIPFGFNQAIVDLIEGKQHYKNSIEILEDAASFVDIMNYLGMW